jgi:hypothetical protein
MEASEIVKRGVVFVVIVVVIAAIAAVGSAAFQSSSSQPVEEPTFNNDEFQPQNVVPEQLPANGAVNDIPQAGGATDGKQILIDAAHENRMNPEDIRPLVRGLVQSGHEVRYLRPREELGPALTESDALIVMDPAEGYTREQATRVDRFTRNGGRVLLAGEPNLNTVQVSLFGAVVSKNRSRLTTLGQQFGISFGTEMIYNMEHNDGNYRNILASPPENRAVEGVDRVALSLGTSVRVRNGRNLLLSAERSNRYGVDDRQRYPVAVQTKDDSAIAVGDTSLFGATRHAIADNEAFIEYVATFLVSGDHQPASTPTPGSDDTPTPSDQVTPPQPIEPPEGTSTPDSTPTPAPTPTPP